ncbi:predicted protein [Sclerotinia sclerotiorum 1980 UF-70]|uniref:Uncharacterized protein n=1 Tax=Sclerotinia sclerotiorum (strain ATCC 18683 / 1980 / Ss-1) TaxID=665079 RepID=A7F9N3_SCLS1|nr:predicted protein [Sclerotinia sclerotiorum 1980 UF-70]EDO00444.1 predicted protein [Sclerotinia sclerotiorum 1980 UF-70]
MKQLELIFPTFWPRDYPISLTDTFGSHSLDSAKRAHRHRPSVPNGNFAGVIVGILKKLYWGFDLHGVKDKAWI